jgi:uncharacterized membrane protein YtjA (UPF0391 family)
MMEMLHVLWLRSFCVGTTWVAKCVWILHVVLYVVTWE